MDRAYNETSDKIEYAFKLKEFAKAYIERSTYLCPNPLCRYPAIPCSYQQHNIPQPYYRYLEGHNPGCCFSQEFGGREVTDSNGRKHWVLPKVVEIKLPKDDIELKNKSVSTSKYTSSTSKTQDRGNTGVSSSGKGKLTSSVAAATIFYMQDVEKNALEPLTLPHIKGKYRSVFQQIYNWKTIESYKPGYIFYADIRYTSELRITDDSINITLNVIEPQTGKMFELKLCCGSWSNKERYSIVDELKRAQRFVAESKDKDEVSSVYFIGRQSESEKHVFECDYAQFLYVYTGIRVKLVNNYFGFKRKESDELSISINPSSTIPRAPAINCQEINQTTIGSLRSSITQSRLEKQPQKNSTNIKKSNSENSFKTQVNELANSLVPQPSLTSFEKSNESNLGSENEKKEAWLNDSPNSHHSKPITKKSSLFKQVIGRLSRLFIDQ